MFWKYCSRNLKKKKKTTKNGVSLCLCNPNPESRHFPRYSAQLVLTAFGQRSAPFRAGPSSPTLSLSVCALKVLTKKKEKKESKKKKKKIDNNPTHSLTLFREREREREREKEKEKGKFLIFIYLLKKENAVKNLCLILFLKCSFIAGFLKHSSA